jgi:hypothetical protein
MPCEKSISASGKIWKSATAKNKPAEKEFASAINNFRFLFIVFFKCEKKIHYAPEV